MVPNCTNGWRKTKGTGVSYHRLSTNHLKSLWLQRVRRDNPRDSKHSFVCSDHFIPETYECSLAEKLRGHTGRKILKPDGEMQFLQFLSTVKTCQKRNDEYQAGSREK
jgi:hypothetical protein